MDKKYMVFDGRKDFKHKDFKDLKKESGLTKVKSEKNIADVLLKMSELQSKLYAENKESLLIIFQAMDAGGKDSTIKKVMSGINPQGTQVYSFKTPTIEELDHDYLWRYMKCLPKRGNIGIFNRSYYEEVLIGKVHNLPKNQNLPDRCLNNDIWKNRYKHIRNFEEYLSENGFTVLKFFLNISKDEQKKRFLERIETSDKNWKFSSADIEERLYWNEYQSAYEDAINETSTKNAPWHIIPADSKWYARLSVAEFIVEALEKLNPQYPKIDDEEKEKLILCKEKLINEDL